MDPNLSESSNENIQVRFLNNLQRGTELYIRFLIQFSFLLRTLFIIYYLCGQFFFQNICKIVTLASCYGVFNVVTQKVILLVRSISFKIHWRLAKAFIILKFVQNIFHLNLKTLTYNSQEHCDIIFYNMYYTNANSDLHH